MSPWPNPIPTARAGCIDFRVRRRAMPLTCEGYVAILDATIDKMLANRHAGMESGEEPDER